MKLKPSRDHFVLALVDAARDPQLFDLLLAEESVCLFDGPLSDRLVRVLPRIVCPKIDGPLVRAWAAHGRGRSWGIWCTTTGPVCRARSKFHNSVQAQLPDGDVVQFRFYDPRVWRAYLPSCNTAELYYWFTGVNTFLAESAGGAGSIRYEFENGTLATRFSERALPDEAFL
jgi:hypothetical protein